MKKHANGYVNQAERFGMETTRAKSVVEGFEVEETKIKSKMADFAVPAHLMMDEGGVGENGEERLASKKIKQNYTAKCEANERNTSRENYRIW